MEQGNFSRDLVTNRGLLLGGKPEDFIELIGWASAGRYTSLREVNAGATPYIVPSGKVLIQKGFLLSQGGLVGTINACQFYYTNNDGGLNAAGPGSNPIYEGGVNGWLSYCSDKNPADGVSGFRVPASKYPSVYASSSGTLYFRGWFILEDA
jgi:hypothetical protein